MFNLLKLYNTLLEISSLSEFERRKSLYGIFKRDIEDDNKLSFKGKKINPIKGREPEMQTLFDHLITRTAQPPATGRVYDPIRSERLHWIRHHIELRKGDVKIFSLDEPDGIKTYILDESEKYVVVLAPYRDGTEYYLITAFYLGGKGLVKMLKKYTDRRLPQIH